jgi:hypothetical protein
VDGLEIGTTITGVDMAEMEYVLGDFERRGLLRANKDVSVHADWCEEYSTRKRLLRVILPALPIPFSIHENSLANIHNSFMSRNNRRFIAELNLKNLKKLKRHAHTFMKSRFPCTDLDVCSEEFYLSSRKWGKSKMDKYLRCEPDIFPSKYVTSGFVKWEACFKSCLKAPRLINNPQTVFKNSFGRWVYSYTCWIKRNCCFDSDFNANSGHINLIWTSGKNRDQLGQLETDILESYEDDEIVMETGTDFSKYESTQVEDIMVNLETIYRNTTRGELRDRLVTLTRFIRGDKTMFATVDGLTNTYKFKATRTSGDITTTLGNTLLLFLIGDFLFRKLSREDKKLVYLMAAGDDGRFIYPKRFHRYVLEGAAWLETIGMKLDLVVGESPELTEYNSSVMLECDDVDNGVRRYHASAKLGKLLAKVGLCFNNLQGRFLDRYRYEKLSSVCNELQLFPGPLAFFKKLLSRYECFKNDKPQFVMRHKDLVTKCTVNPTARTTEQLANRYGVTTGEWDMFNTVFAGFDPNTYWLCANRDYGKIQAIMKKIIEIDVVKYDADDIYAFGKYFNRFYLQGYEDYLM